MLTAIVITISIRQLAFAAAAAVALLLVSILLAFDDGRYRGRREGRAAERELRELERRQLREEQWFPRGGAR